ncbi:heparinase II/III family protein [Emcibacteraceae bacterium]|nr:heparinase II/III family protein [Emcibacteraceae bacterium]
MGTLKKIILIIRTLTYLKPIQVTNRIIRKISSKSINRINFPETRNITKHKIHFIERSQSILTENKFTFLNHTKELNSAKDWNNPKYPKLWLYNLHYFDGLLNNITDPSFKTNLINRWVDENPVGFGNGWEPYPNSLRIVNWIKWHLSNGELNNILLENLVLQVRYLTKTIEYHLLGNHLFANAKALIFAGIFFKGKEAENWFHKGKGILEKQIPEQFLQDGAHFELSTTYHALLTEDLLDIIQIMRIAEKPIPESWINIAQKAINWLTGITRPDGMPPLFNDAAYGITPSLEEIISLSKILGINENKEIKPGLNDFRESGYFRYEADDYSFFGDIGQIGPDYIPGHAHCDMLNFELFAHRTPVIVDTGISTYEVGKRRQLERGTKSHNTVQIRDSEQTEIWGAFRVARRAKIITRNIKGQTAIGAYKGYCGSVHKRAFSFNTDSIIIADEINEENYATARLHFHPSINVIITDKIVTAGPIKIEFSNETNILLKKYYYAPEFNKLIEADLLEISFIGHLKTKFII